MSKRKREEQMTTQTQAPDQTKEKIQTAQTIIDNAMAACANIERDEKQCYSIIENASLSLEKLDQMDREATTHLETLKRSADDAEQRYQDAVAYAELAGNTPNEASAMSALEFAEKQKEDTARQYRLGQQAFYNAQSVNVEKRTTLNYKLEMQSERLRELAERKAHYCSIRERSMRELGELTSKEYRDRIAVLEREIEERRREIDTLQTALGTKPYQDATTRILESAQTFFDALLSDGKQCHFEPNILYRVRRIYEPVDLLFVSYDYLQSALHPTRDAWQLREQRDDITSVLNLHREYRRNHH